MRAILSRELQSYFYTPIGYVYMGVFLTLGSVFFAVNNLAARSGDVLTLLWDMSYLWLLLSPILTMRSYAGEKKARTDQLLFTSPVSLSGVVLGKFLAAAAVLLITVVISFVYPLIVAMYGKVYFGELFAGYLGFILQGCFFIALDMLLSSRANSPTTAAVMAFGANMLLWLLDVVNAAVDMSVFSRALDFISPYIRYEPFTLGQLSFASLIYYVLAIALCLYLTVRTLDKRRWSE
ncbi:MAG: ABC transporter permease [Clostridia bacterium]|nr:ABC transporter permease [Clostridia bacterium]